MFLQLLSEPIKLRDNKRLRQAYDNVKKKCFSRLAQLSSRVFQRLLLLFRCHRRRAWLIEPWIIDSNARARCEWFTATSCTNCLSFASRGYLNHRKHEGEDGTTHPAAPADNFDARCGHCWSHRRNHRPSGWSRWRRSLVSSANGHVRQLHRRHFPEDAEGADFTAHRVVAGRCSRLARHFAIKEDRIPGNRLLHVDHRHGRDSWNHSCRGHRAGKWWKEQLRNRRWENQLTKRHHRRHDSRSASVSSMIPRVGKSPKIT